MSKYGKKKATPGLTRKYEILRTPVVTEKSTVLSDNNQVVFQVALDANKLEIRAAVEGLFGVKVRAVNTIRVKGKNKNFNGRRGKRIDRKKAVVTLAEGDSIDVMTGL